MKPHVFASIMATGALVLMAGFPSGMEPPAATQTYDVRTLGVLPSEFSFAAVDADTGYTLFAMSRITCQPGTPSSDARADEGRIPSLLTRSFGWENWIDQPRQGEDALKEVRARARLMSVDFCSQVPAQLQEGDSWGVQAQMAFVDAHQVHVWAVTSDNVGTVTPYGPSSQSTLVDRPVNVVGDAFDVRISYELPTEHLHWCQDLGLGGSPVVSASHAGDEGGGRVQMCVQVEYSNPGEGEILSPG